MRTEIVDGNGNVIGWDDSLPLSVEEVNANAISVQARQAMAVNRTFIARGATNTAVQVRDETLALARQMNGVIRLLLNQLDGTD